MSFDLQTAAESVDSLGSEACFHAVNLILLNLIDVGAKEPWELFTLSFPAKSRDALKWIYCGDQKNGGQCDIAEDANRRGQSPIVFVSIVVVLNLHLIALKVVNVRSLLTHMYFITSCGSTAYPKMTLCLKIAGYTLHCFWAK